MGSDGKGKVQSLHHQAPQRMRIIPAFLARDCQDGARALRARGSVGGVAYVRTSKCWRKVRRRQREANSERLPAVLKQYPTPTRLLVGGRRRCCHRSHKPLPPYPFTEWPFGGSSAIGATVPNSQDGALMKALAPVRPVKGQQLAAWAARSQGAARQREDTCRSDLDNVLHRFRAVSTSTVDGRTCIHWYGN